MSPDQHSDYIVRTVNTPHQFSYENGILLTGGGAQLAGLDRYLAEKGYRDYE